MLDLRTLRQSPRFRRGQRRFALVHHGFRTTQLGFKDRGRARFAPRYASLGLLNVARSLQVDFERGLLPSEPDIRYFDEDHYVDDDTLARAVTEWLREGGGGFVLVGVYSLAAERTATFLSKFDPSEFCIVVGGAHPTVAPHIDYAHVVVRGEGGAAIRHIVNYVLEDVFGQGADAQGVCFEADGHVHISGPAFDRSIATIAPPAFAYELVEPTEGSAQPPQERWWKAVGRNPQIYICTQSCRARCTFCSTYMIHGRLVSRPVDLVEADLTYIVDEYGHDSIQFHDDDLLQHDQLDKLLEVLARTGTTWTCNARSEFITPNLARQLYAAGCRKVFLGVESLDQRSLDYYRKATTVEMNERAVESLDSAGIGVVCGFIIGAPHDTVESSLADIDRMLALPVYFLSASILTPDIGTVEFHRAKKRNPQLRLLGDEGTKLNIRPRPELFGEAPPYGLPTVCEALTKQELNELYDLACCEFFLRDSSVERIWRHTLPDRLEEVDQWYRWTRERVVRLADSSTLEPVRERAERLARSGWDAVPALADQSRRPSGPLSLHPEVGR